MSEEKLDKLFDAVNDIKTEVAVIKNTQVNHTQAFKDHERQTNEKVNEIKSNIRWWVGIATTILIAVIASAWAVFTYIDSKNLGDSQITATINLKGNVTDVVKNE